MSAASAESTPQSRRSSANLVAATVVVVTVVVCTLAALIVAVVALGRTNRSASGSTSGSTSRSTAGTAPGTLSGAARGANLGAARTISVEGTAEQRVAPDFATIQLTVSVNDPSPVAAQQANADKQAAVVSAIKAAGVNTKDVSPGGTDISQITQEVNSTTVTLYRATTEISFDTKDLPKVAAVLASAFSAGATTGQVEFKTTRLRELRDKARLAAVQAARDKARDLTGGVNASIGQVLSIGEGETHYWGPQRNYVNNVQNSTPVNVPSGPEVGAMSEQFGGGTIRVSATVSTTFEIA
jgi:uncharacterized protein